MSDTTANPAELPIPADCKRCSKCKEVKPLAEFNRRNDSRLGYKSQCKNCQSTSYGHKPKQPKAKPRYLPEINAIEITLTKGYVAIVDTIDADLAELEWCAKVLGGLYAHRTEYRDGGQQVVSLHRAVLSKMLGRPLEPKEMVDHENLNGLDCRRENLRLATATQNQGNKKVRADSSSGIKGVYARGKRWRAAIRINGKLKYFGLFDTAEEAASAYREAAIKYFGEFARTE